MCAYTVYKHTSPSGKVYIGITALTTERRWRNHGCGYRLQPYFYHAIQKYGWENFQHEIIYTDLTKEEACTKEIELIAFFKSNHRDYGYNISTGGEHGGTGCVISEETRAKLREAQHGENNGFYGKHHSEETRKKLSKMHSGKHLSEETRRKISEGNKGKLVSEETRRKIGEANRGRYYSKETREKLAKTQINHPTKSKRVGQYTLDGELIREFPSLREAGRSTGICREAIGATCRGEQKSCNGFKWKYI